MTRRQRHSGEGGFTLIELLVVILIIAILAAIAIPVFFAQREKGFQAQIQSALKNAAHAVEGYAAENNGNYSGLDEASTNACPAGPTCITTLLGPHGFQLPQWAGPNPARFEIEATTTAYCLEARHARLTANSAWRTSTYASSSGVPVPVPDDCPNNPN